MCGLLAALLLDRYAVVLLVKLERSVVADFERLHAVSSDVEQIITQERYCCCFCSTNRGFSSEFTPCLTLRRFFSAESRVWSKIPEGSTFIYEGT